MAPILVTGPTGNVGAAVVRALTGAGAEVRLAMPPGSRPLTDAAHAVDFDFTSASESRSRPAPRAEDSREDPPP